MSGESIEGDPSPGDVLAALGWLREGTAFKRITTGWDNRIWRFEDASGVHALRLYRHGGPGALATADAEALAMEAASAAGLPVPRIEARGAFEDAPAFVVEWARGNTFVDLVSARPWNVLRLGRAMGLLHARLHAAPLPEGLRVGTVEDVYRVTDIEKLNAAVAAQARFDTFCHLDFHPLNLLGSGAEPTAVLDWTNAAIADRRIDLAFTFATLRVVPLPPGGPRVLISGARRVLALGWRQGYTAEAGEFPLDALFRAFGVARYVGEAERAVAEGRGWLTERDVVSLRRVRNHYLATAGL